LSDLELLDDETSGEEFSFVPPVEPEPETADELFAFFNFKPLKVIPVMLPLLEEVDIAAAASAALETAGGEPAVGDLGCG
jgi:hypothetical protein